MKENSIQVLLVVENDTDHDLVRTALLQKRTESAAYFTLERRESFETGLAALRNTSFDIVLVSYHLSSHTGFDFFRAASAQGCDIPVILLVEHLDHDIDDAAMYTGIADCVEKISLDSVRLEHTLRYAIHRHRKERELKESLHLYRTVAEGSPDAVFAKDIEGRYLMINTTGAQFLGKYPDEVIGSDGAELFSDTDHEVKEADRLVITSGQTRTFQSAGTAAGVRRTFLTTKGPIRDNADAIIGLFGIARDITQQKIAEEALRASEARFRTLIQSSWDVFHTLDKTGRILFESPSVTQLLGYLPEEMVGRYCTDFVHVDEVPLAQSMIQDISTTPGSSRVEVVRAKHKDGSWRWVECAAINLLDHPDVKAIVVNYRDVTTRKAAEDEIRFQAHLLNTVGQAVIATDLDGNIIYWNHAAETIYGWSTQEAVGRNITALIVPEKGWVHAREIMARIRSSAPCSYEFVAQHRDRTTFPVSVTSTLLVDSNGVLIGMVGASSDIRASKAAEEALQSYAAELAAMRDAALAANHAKSAFLANMSHEIRTPMNGVLGMTQLLALSELDREQQDYVETLRQSSEALLTIIDDILDFSQLEAGKITIHPVLFDLEAVLSGVISLMRPTAQQKGVAIRLLLHPPIPTPLYGDSGRIRQILLNLVGNAIKFTDSGAVTVTCTVLNQESEAIRIRIAVQDTGIGISLPDQKRLFQSFTQLDASHTRRFGGTGLGLMISKQLVELMHGMIGLESTPGMGSTFWIELPLRTTPQRKII